MDELPKKSFLSALFDPPKRLTHSGRIGYRIIQFSCFLFCIVFILTHYYFMHKQDWGNVLMFVSLLIFIVGGVLVSQSSRKVQKFAKLHDYQLCPNCNNPLDEQPQDGLCLDCGEQYNHEELRKYWKPSKKFKRAKRRFRLYIYGTVIVWIITFFLRLLFLLPNIPISVLIYRDFIHLFVLIGLAIGLAISIRARCFAKRHDFLVCPECMYPIAKDKEIQVCSECGTKMYATEVVDYWESWGKAKTPNFNHLGPAEDD